MTRLLLFATTCSKTDLEKMALAYKEIEKFSHVLNLCYCLLNFVTFCVTSQFPEERSIVCQFHYKLPDLFLERNIFKEGIVPC
jgi:hypothetical protein